MYSLVKLGSFPLEKECSSVVSQDARDPFFAVAIPNCKRVASRKQKTTQKTTAKQHPPHKEKEASAYFRNIACQSIDRSIDRSLKSTQKKHRTNHQPFNHDVLHQVQAAPGLRQPVRTVGVKVHAAWWRKKQWRDGAVLQSSRISKSRSPIPRCHQNAP